MHLPMRWFYWLRAKFQRWNYKRKYGIEIEEGIKYYGKWVLLNETPKD